MGKKSVRLPDQGEANLFRQTVSLPLRKGERRKFEIVQATLKCIATLGVDHTNYETVGTLCRLKRPHVAYYFPDREEMIEAAIRYAYATGQQFAIDAVAATGNRDDRLKAYVHAAFSWLEAYPHHRSAVALLVYLSTYSNHFRGLSEELKAMAMARLGVILSPSALPKPNVKELAERLHTLLSGEILYWATCKSKLSTADFSKRTKKGFLDLVERERL